MKENTFGPGGGRFARRIGLNVSLFGPNLGFLLFTAADPVKPNKNQADKYRVWEASGMNDVVYAVCY